MSSLIFCRERAVLTSKETLGLQYCKQAANSAKTSAPFDVVANGEVDSTTADLTMLSFLNLDWGGTPKVVTPITKIRSHSPEHSNGTCSGEGPDYKARSIAAPKQPQFLWECSLNLQGFGTDNGPRFCRTASRPSPMRRWTGRLQTR
jgi:hypothetical protein